MALRLLEYGSPALDEFLRFLTSRRRDGGGAIDASVARIISQVRRRGDRALLALTRQFDGIKLEPGRIRVDRKEIESALDSLPPAERRALELAARRIGAFHRRTV